MLWTSPWLDARSSTSSAGRGANTAPGPNIVLVNGGGTRSAPSTPATISATTIPRIDVHGFRLLVRAEHPCSGQRSLLVYDDAAVQGCRRIGVRVGAGFVVVDQTVGAPDAYADAIRAPAGYLAID